VSPRTEVVQGEQEISNLEEDHEHPAKDVRRGIFLRSYVVLEADEDGPDRCRDLWAKGHAGVELLHLEPHVKWELPRRREARFVVAVVVMDVLGEVAISLQEDGDGVVQEVDAEPERR